MAKGSSLQNRARLHNYAHYKIGKIRNQIYEIGSLSPMSDESRHAMHAVLTKLHEFKQTMHTRRDQEAQAEKPVIMFYDD